jgi:hypothetical protein
VCGLAGRRLPCRFWASGREHFGCRIGRQFGRPIRRDSGLFHSIELPRQVGHRPLESVDFGAQAVNIGFRRQIGQAKHRLNIGVDTCLCARQRAGNSRQGACHSVFAKDLASLRNKARYTIFYGLSGAHGGTLKAARGPGKVGRAPIIVCWGLKALLPHLAGARDGAPEVLALRRTTLVRTLIFPVAALLLAVATPALAESTPTYFRTDTPQFRASAEFGHQMFTAYQCAKCHATVEGQPLNDDIVAPNLILSKERLRPEWILDWLIDPQKLQIGTKMPNFFSFTEDDDGHFILGDADAHQQHKIVVALRDYLMILGTEMDPEYKGPIAVTASTETAIEAAPAAEAVEEAPADVGEWNDYYGY